MDTWVISLPHRTDRLAMFAGRAHMAGLKYTVQQGVVVDGEYPEQWRGTAGSLGCALAHREILANNTGPLMIFEDDALIAPDTMDWIDKAVAQLPEDWEVLVIGGERAVYGEDWRMPIHQVQWWHQTHAYAVSEAGREVALQANLDSVNHWDHLFAERAGRRGKSWLMIPGIGQDTEMSSDIHG